MTRDEIFAALGLEDVSNGGYAGGWLDSLIMRAVDILLSFPGILIAILVVMATSRTSWLMLT